MAAVPPLVALLFGQAAAFARSFPISVLAAVLAAFTRLVPLAIILLIVSTVVALRKVSPLDLRHAWQRRRHAWRLTKPILLAAPFVWLGAYILSAYLRNNWSPPRSLEQALLESRTLERNQALTAILQARLPDGTDEMVVKASLAKEGFVEVLLPQQQCRAQQTWQSFAVVPCPDQPRQMSYAFRHLSLLCDVTRLVVDWRVDPAGRATQLRASDQTRCY